jgi:two-component system sensor histidine kinase BarA
MRRDVGSAQPVERTSDDETGRLVDAFNAMLAEVRARDAALTQHRDRLAAEVSERTHELALAKSAAERANEAKSEFLATMSHEIRTPMNGLLVTAELLATEALSPRARRHCELIVKSGQILVSLINDILDLSKIEAGHLVLERIPLSPARTVEDVLRIFAEHAASKQLQLACYISRDVPEGILGDPLRLTQVVSNLVSNALKFTETGGVLVMLEAAPGPTGPEQTQLRISVRDTGIGIDQARIATLFDAFTQAESSTSRLFGGTGIGLTICRRLVTAMGGRIDVESEPGVGATFRVTVPAVVTSPAPTIPARGATGRHLALRIEKRPVRDALMATANDIGATTVDSDDETGTEVVIVDGSSIEAENLRSKRPARSILAFDRLGGPAAHRLLADGMVDGVIDAPIGGRETQALLRRALAGEIGTVTARAESALLPIPPDVAFAGVRVLAADDNAVNREVLSEALARLGVEVTSVESGAAAISALRNGEFDLVFMDGSMPEMDGFEACRRIRSLEIETGRKPVPVVALTAHVFGDRAQAWRDAGMNACISKPFTLADIRNCLVHHVGGHSIDDGKEKPSAAVDTAAAAPIIDRSVLQSVNEIAGPGDDLAGRVIRLFAEHAPRKLDLLLSLPTQDVTTRPAAAHALKSMCRNIGAVRLADLCEAIEDGSADPSASEMQVALSDTLAELQRLDAPRVQG